MQIINIYICLKYAERGKHAPIQQKQIVKCQEKPTPDFQCSICVKTYPKQADLQSHIKLKHEKPQKQKQKQPTKPKSIKVQPRNRVLEMQQNDHEDTIYSYLGELGEKNQQNSSREDLLLVDQNQRQSIQTNYSFNKVVRTPYQKQLITINQIPNQWISKTPHKEFINNLVVEMTLLYHALELQKQKWQFRDPMAPEQEAQDQFSLMQIRKLILNYPRRNLNLNYPHFSIFLLWIGRICKPQAWEQFFIVISYYLAEYYIRDLQGKPLEKWEQFNTEFQKQQVKPYVSQGLSICDDKTIKKFTQFFNKWTTLFELTNEFC